MLINRDKASTERSEEVAAEVSTLPMCVGCTNCRGVCAALIEAMTVPDAILRSRA